MWTYDPTVDAGYVSFSTASVARTVPLDDRTIVDYDADGNTVGVEFLCVSTMTERR